MEKHFQLLVIMMIVVGQSLESTIGHRLGNSDSILDIINTENVQRYIAERRLNSSRNDRFYIKNDLDDEFSDTENNGDVYQTPDSIAFDLQMHSGRGNNNGGRNNKNRRPIDVITRYNDTTRYNENYHQQQNSADILQDLNAYRAGKVLRSSKNALIVTKKEYLKKDWCKTQPLVQRIREDGCLSKTIINRFCYGQCNSFYIPKSPRRNTNRNGDGGNGGSVGSNGNTNNNNQQQHKRRNRDFEDEDLTQAAFRSCANCKPKKFTWMTVTLRCPSLVPQLRKKKIQRIKQCKCIAEPLN